MNEAKDIMPFFNVESRFIELYWPQFVTVTKNKRPFTPAMLSIVYEARDAWNIYKSGLRFVLSLVKPP